MFIISTAPSAQQIELSTSKTKYRPDIRGFQRHGKHLHTCWQKSACMLSLSTMLLNISVLHMFSGAAHKWSKHIGPSTRQQYAAVQSCQKPEESQNLSRVDQDRHRLKLQDGGSHTSSCLLCFRSFVGVPVSPVKT